MRDAITFRAEQNAWHANTHTCQATNGQRVHRIDVETNNTSLIVPLGVYVRYAGHAPSLTLSGYLGLDLGPIPLWIVTSNGLGTPVGQEDVQSLQNENVPFTRPNGTRRTSLFFRIRWPGYPEWEAQVRLDNNKTTDAFTFKRLVELVKGQVRKFIKVRRRRSNPSQEDVLSLDDYVFPHHQETLPVDILRSTLFFS
ncbi:unnamed protein product [Peniophora sp. CBMAI 1063]|nr:unnamed protein product [Peniophora sp. CBMAI 1063]